MSDFVAGSVKGFLTLDMRQWRAGVDTARSDTAQLRRNFSNIQQSATQVSLGLGAIALAAKGVLGSLVTMAAKVQESDNLFDVSMGSMAASTRKWTDQISKALGINAAAVRETVGTFNVIIGSLGFTEDAAAKMAKNFTLLSYDLESFYNIPHEQALEKLRAGLTGEVEPLKALGILVSETMVQQFAWRNGIAAVGADLTEQQKVIARYGLIMETTNKAQGDLSRTGSSVTNQFRRMQSGITSVAQELGSKLLPVAGNYLSTANGIIDRVRGWISANGDLVDSFINIAEKGSTYIGVIAGVTLGIVGLTRAFTFLRSAAALAWAITFGPLTLGAAAIAGIGAALYSLRANFKDTFDAAGNTINSWLSGVEGAGIGGKLAKALGWAAGGAEWGANVAAKSIGALTGNTQPIIDAWNEDIHNIADEVSQGAGELKTMVSNLFSGSDDPQRPSFLDTIKKQLTVDWDGLKGYLESQAPGMTSLVERLVNSLTVATDGSIDALNPEYIKSTMKELLDGINQAVAGSANTKNYMDEINPVESVYLAISNALTQTMTKFGENKLALDAWAHWAVDTYGQKVPGAISETIDSLMNVATLTNSPEYLALANTVRDLNDALSLKDTPAVDPKNRLMDNFKMSDPKLMAADLQKQMNEAGNQGLNLDGQGASMFSQKYWQDLSDEQRASIGLMASEFSKLPAASTPAGKRVIADIKGMFSTENIQAFGAGLTGLGQQVSQLGPKFSTVGRVISGIGNMVSIVGKGIQIFAKISEASAMTTRLAWESALGIFGLILEAVYTLASAFGFLGEKGKKEAKGMDKVWKDFGSSLDGMLDDLSKKIVDGEANFAEFANNAIKSLTDIAVKELLLQPIVDFGKHLLFNEKGNAFSAGNVVPFARGGVVTAPTVFPMSGGRAGVMGEKGPEAVMPLERLPGGRLGVNAAGAAGGGQIIQLIDQRQAGAPPIEFEPVRGPNGQQIMRAYVRDVLHDEVNSGRIDKVLGRNFGIRRTGS